MPATPIDPNKLDKLAEVAIKVGLGLKPVQDLYMTAPTSAATTPNASNAPVNRALQSMESLRRRTAHVAQG